MSVAEPPPLISLIEPRRHQARTVNHFLCQDEPSFFPRPEAWQRFKRFDRILHCMCFLLGISPGSSGILCSPPLQRLDSRRPRPRLHTQVVGGYTTINGGAGLVSMSSAGDAVISLLIADQSLSPGVSLLHVGSGGRLGGTEERVISDQSRERRNAH